MILLLSNDAPSFQSNSLMNFLDILVGWTWGCEIFGLVNSSVNQFTPIFPHFLFIDQPQIFTHKFRINSDNFNVLIPQSEYLSWNDVYILQDLIGKFVWVESIWSSHCYWYESIAPCHHYFIPSLGIFLEFSLVHCLLRISLHYLVNLAFCSVIYVINVILVFSEAFIIIIIPNLISAT